MARNPQTPGPLVAGEPANALARALIECQTETTVDGRVHVDLQLAGVMAAPLARALLRVEAELLVHDAAKISPVALVPDRSAAQRRADAFVALVLRVGEAVAS